MTHAISRVTFITALLAAVSPALAACDAEEAVTGLQQCRNQIHQIEKHRFNASNADHIEQVCCTVLLVHLSSAKGNFLIFPAAPRSSSKTASAKQYVFQAATTKWTTL
nr:uncharacterized protein LOC126545390 isoform X4 [Dermacentor andersoni]